MNLHRKRIKWRFIEWCTNLRCYLFRCLNCRLPTHVNIARARAIHHEIWGEQFHILQVVLQMVLTKHLGSFLFLISSFDFLVVRTSANKHSLPDIWNECKSQIAMNIHFTLLFFSSSFVAVITMHPTQFPAKMLRNQRMHMYWARINLKQHKQKQKYNVNV